MNIFNIKMLYFSWHYSIAFRDISRIFTNILWFLYHFFSIGVLSSTLFSPWKRLTSEGDESEGGKFGKFIINTIMRLIGFVVRIVTLVVGIVCILISAVLGILFYIIWIVLPVIIVALLAFGIISLTL